jgi:hypothetical protein
MIDMELQIDGPGGFLDRGLNFQRIIQRQPEAHAGDVVSDDDFELFSSP